MRVVKLVGWLVGWLVAWLDGWMPELTRVGVCFEWVLDWFGVASVMVWWDCLAGWD